MTSHELHWWSGVHPLLAFAVLFAVATVLACAPGLIARRRNHAHAAIVNLFGVAWLLIGFPTMWFFPQTCPILAIAWCAITLAAFASRHTHIPPQ